MRVTTNMIFDRTLFNLSRNIDRYMHVESMLSSGRRINAPSDDPVGTHHDLSYRTRLSDIEQYLSNISQGVGWMTSYESGLADLKDLYSAAKEIAITMNNETNDTEVTRETAANEVESILEQVMQIANTKIDGRYMYAGHLTRTLPLESSSNGVVYWGDRGIIDMEVDISSRINSNLIGEDLFLKQLMVLGEDADLEVGLTGATLLADLNLGNGVDLSTGTFEIVDNNRNITYTIDVSTATTVDDVINAINTQLGAAANLSVAISESGASLQWEPVTPATNSITIDTALTNLNSGTGIDMEPGTFVIRNDDSSIYIEVDISTASTVGDVLTTIVTSLFANGVGGVGVGFNADGTGLAITDGNAIPLGLIVEESSENQTTASDLGLFGRVQPSLQGRDLSPLPDFTISDIGGQIAADLGLAGIIHNPTVGGSIRPQITLGTALSSLNNNTGFMLGEIKISQGNQNALIDLNNSSIVTVADLLGAINGCGLDVSATINDAGTGIQVVSTVTNKSLIIESNDSARAAHNLGLVGSSDMIGSLMLMINSLRANDREVLGQLLENMDLAMDEQLSARATIGARMIRMETTRNRLEGARISVTRMLSEVEDADIVSLVSELAREENLYQAALIASSKIMQQSLVDFLR
jgi:flagellar hook-associated protein 3